MSGPLLPQVHEDQLYPPKHIAIQTIELLILTNAVPATIPTGSPVPTTQLILKPVPSYFPCNAFETAV